MKKTATLLLPVLLLIFSGCQKDKQLENRLEGTWNITHYENIKIFNDGSIETLAEAENAGTFTFYRDADDLSIFDFSYTANGTTESGSNVYYMIDDHAKRLIIIGGLCIGCDKAYTIEENSKNHQEWSIYSLQQQGLSTDFVYKKKFVLDR